MRHAGQLTRRDLRDKICMTGVYHFELFFGMFEVDWCDAGSLGSSTEYSGQTGLSLYFGVGVLWCSLGVFCRHCNCFDSALGKFHCLHSNGVNCAFLNPKQSNCLLRTRTEVEYGSARN